MSSDARRKQKAAEKRKQRELRLRREQAERRAAQAAGGTQEGPKKLKDLPLVECVISAGWEERGTAHILVARRLAEGHLAVAGFFVDTLCVGLKDTAVIERVTDEEYEHNVKPNVFHDPVELVPCDLGLARAVVEGAIDFAGTFGFKPNKRWDETRGMLAGAEPAPAPVFGRDGKPWYVDRGESNARGVLARLERVAGPGNYGTEKGPKIGEKPVS